MSPDFGHNDWENSQDDGALNDTTTDSTDDSGGLDVAVDPQDDGGVNTVSIEDYPIADLVIEHAGHDDWEVLEILLSSHATLLLDGDDSSHGIIVEGYPSSGKSTLLELLRGNDRQTLHVDKFTTASLLSGYRDDDDDDGRKSLLEDARSRSIVTTDLGPLVEGDESTVKENWSTIARAMDGGRYSNATGTKGRQTVDDLHFNLLAGTTPMDARKHEMIGKAGGRVLFLQKTMDSSGDARKLVFRERGEPEYGEVKDTCSQKVHNFLSDLWRHHGGPKSVDMPQRTDDERAEDAYVWLTDAIRGTRSNTEDPKRLMSLIRDLSRGHALIYGRTRHGMEDLDVCIRAGLDSAPSAYRPVLQLVLRRAGDPVTTNEVKDALGVSSKKTAIKRMEALAEADVETNLVELTEQSTRGGMTKAIELPEEETWAEEVSVV